MVFEKEFGEEKKNPLRLSFKTEAAMTNIFPHWFQALSKAQNLQRQFERKLVTCACAQLPRQFTQKRSEKYSLKCVNVWRRRLSNRPNRIKTVDPGDQEARSEPLCWSMNETLRRDRVRRRGLSAIWGTDCWNGCSHWCKVHPLFGLLPDSASNQCSLYRQTFPYWLRLVWYITFGCLSLPANDVLKQ